MKKVHSLRSTVHGEERERKSRRSRDGRRKAGGGRRDPGEAGIKVVSREQIEDALRRVSEVSPDGTALAGGVAMAAYGSPRLTGDVDVLASSGFPVHELVPPKAGSRRRGRALTFGGREIPLPSGVTLDLIVRDDRWRRLYREALQESLPFKSIPGMRIVRPEYLVAMKMVAGRPKDEDDLMFLLSSVTLDKKRLARILERHLGPYALEEVQHLEREAKWRKREGLL